MCYFFLPDSVYPCCYVSALNHCNALGGFVPLLWVAAQPGLGEGRDLHAFPCSGCSLMLSPCSCLPHTHLSAASLQPPLPTVQPSCCSPSFQPSLLPATPLPICPLCLPSQCILMGLSRVGNWAHCAQFHFKSMVESFNLWQAGAAAGEHC